MHLPVFGYQRLPSNGNAISGSEKAITMRYWTNTTNSANGRRELNPFGVSQTATFYGGFTRLRTVLGRSSKAAIVLSTYSSRGSKIGIVDGRPSNHRASPASPARTPFFRNGSA